MQADPSEFDFLVRSLARRYARRGSDIEDFEQEAKIAVFTGLKEWKPETRLSLKNYLGFRIKHALKEFCRTHYRPGFVSLDEEVSEDEGGCSRTRHDVTGKPPSQESQVLSSLVAENITELSENEQKALLLYAEGMSFTEVAESLGIKRQSVTETIHRAQKRLAKSAA